jgi:hypothetical protein
MEKVNLLDKLALFTDHWKPKIVGELNGQQAFRDVIEVYVSSCNCILFEVVGIPQNTSISLAKIGAAVLSITVCWASCLT